MKIVDAEVVKVEKLTESIYLLKVENEFIAKNTKPGQFCNIKVTNSQYPLLRRPFSVSNIEGNYVYFMFDVHGEGTQHLANKQPGETLNILGPLGNGFSYEEEFDTAVILGGGLGIAPFPLLTKYLMGKNIISILGGRNKDFVTSWQLENPQIATDDGSVGYKGNVLQLMEELFSKNKPENIKIFSCGPTPMLKAVQQYSLANNIKADLSTECAMACGFGICQGCPVESSEEGVYKLVCKDGPVFSAEEIKL